MELRKTMNDYILETPETILSNIKNRKMLTSVLCDEFLLRDYKAILVVASGSSYNACISAKPFVETVLKLDMKVVTPYTFVNYTEVKDEEFLIIVSQSGCSTNAIEAINLCKSKNRKVIGVTGNMLGDFYDICDIIIDYGVGEEKVGYVTKGMISLILFFMLFAIEASQQKKIINSYSYNKYIDQLNKCMEAHKDIYNNTVNFYENNKKDLLSLEKVYICGANANYGTALEGALKIGETIKVPSFAYEVEEYIHGPNLQLTPNYTVFFIDGNDKASDRILQIYQATRSITDRVYIISNNLKIEDNHIIKCSYDLPELLSPLYNICVFEYLSFRITTDLNKWNNHPLLDNFEKIVKSKSDKYTEY